MRRGFTLIELMIVVAIIAIIAAIAIPSLLGSKKAANESAAIGHLSALSKGVELCKTKTGYYPGTLATAQSYCPDVDNSGTGTYTKAPTLKWDRASYFMAYWPMDSSSTVVATDTGVKWTASGKPEAMPAALPTSLDDNINGDYVFYMKTLNPVRRYKIFTGGVLARITDEADDIETNWASYSSIK